MCPPDAAAFRLSATSRTNIDRWIDDLRTVHWSRVIEGLTRCGLITGEEEVIFRNVMHIKYANIIFDLECAAATATVHGYLNDLGIQSCGRYGEWAYIWTDESFVSGEDAASRVIDDLGRRHARIAQSS